MPEKDNNQGSGRIRGYEAFKKASEEQPPEPPQPTDPEEHFIVDLTLSIPGGIELPVRGTIKRANGT